MLASEVRRFTSAQDEVYTNPKSSAYYSELAFQHMSEMRLLLVGGRLNKKDEWDNVYRHCLVQIGVMDILCDFLGIAADDKSKLLKVAAVHDWKKRIEITQVDPNTDPAWIENILKHYNKVNPDVSLMSATGPEFVETGLNGKSTKLQDIAFYVDDIVDGEMVFPVLDRLYLNKLKGGVKKLDADHKLTSRLGEPYSDAEIRLATTIEQRLAKIIGENMEMDLESPESIPTLILEEMNRRINSFCKFAGEEHF